MVEVCLIIVPFAALKLSPRETITINLIGELNASVVHVNQPRKINETILQPIIWAPLKYITSLEELWF